MTVYFYKGVGGVNRSLSSHLGWLTVVKTLEPLQVQIFVTRVTKKMTRPLQGKGQLPPLATSPATAHLHFLFFGVGFESCIESTPTDLRKTVFKGKINWKEKKGFDVVFLKREKMSA